MHTFCQIGNKNVSHSQALPAAFPFFIFPVKAVCGIYMFQHMNRQLAEKLSIMKQVKLNLISTSNGALHSLDMRVKNLLKDAPF